MQNTLEVLFSDFNCFLFVLGRFYAQKIILTSKFTFYAKFYVTCKWTFLQTTLFQQINLNVMLYTIQPWFNPDRLNLSYLLCVVSLTIASHFYEWTLLTSTHWIFIETVECWNLLCAWRQKQAFSYNSVFVFAKFN